MNIKNNSSAPYEEGPDWQRRYDENSTRWERGSLNPAFGYWQKQGAFAGIASVIVPGCGRSPEPLAFANMGANVTALDFAPTAVTFQKDAFVNAGLEAQIEAADVLKWQPRQPVDAIYDQTCLCALTPAVWPDYTDQLYRWLKPGGRAFMLFMQTGKEGGPPFHCALSHMREIFDETHWQWPDEPPQETDHSNEKVELGVILTRR